MTKIIGILNVTPDSFSDGGKYNETLAAVAHARQMIKDGANIIDVGAESTRPGAKVISDKEEWQRLVAILPAVINEAHSNNVEVSLDSYHAPNIAKGLDLGIDYINDVSGAKNKEIIKLAAKSGCKIVINHNLGIPSDKQIVLPDNIDVVAELSNWFSNKVAEFKSHGVLDQQIILDIGIGFGKTALQSFELIERIAEFKTLGYPIYVGHSRKSLLGAFAESNLAKELIAKHQYDVTNNDKDYLTNLITAYLKGRIEYVRVHNVRLAVGIRDQCKSF